MNISHLGIMLFILALSSSVHAEIYKWIDGNGNVHFTDVKPAASASVERLHTLEAEAIAIQSRSVDNNTQAETPQVDLYITSWCPYCKKAMAYLRSKNIAFKTYDIERDPDAAGRKSALDPNYSGIPLAVINGILIRGFDEGDYKQALETQPD